jgi:SAM-dependent methyltransferase
VTWPLPALAAWAAAWASFIGLRALGAPTLLALALASGLGIALAVFGTTRWRRLFIAAGFPLSLAASGLAGALPGWAWLMPLVLLVALYPLNTWRDAPLFPTPTGALRGLAALAPLPAQARVLDAGCGLGAGLRELHAEYPTAQLAGLEWSWPLRLACALRCRFASVRRADIWTADWSGHDLVYLFQRPESMARAVDKAARELRPGAWLASLEFEASGLRPTAQLPGAKPVWLYRAPFVRR